MRVGRRLRAQIDAEQVFGQGFPGIFIAARAARNGSAFIGGLSRSSSELAAKHVGEEASPTAAIGKH